MYSKVKEMYKSIGVDTDKAIEKLKNISVSIHCWQGDDVAGFDNVGELTGGIQATGNYPGRARNAEELMADIDKVLSLVGGKNKLNLHASYACFEDGEWADRDELEPKHFKKWVDFARDRGLGLDFNPTFFSHKMVKDNLTLSSPDEEVRSFWVEHGKRCLKIAEYFANELNTPCVMNIWIPDGYKDIPADRLSPRARFKKSLDEILSIDYDKSKVFVTLESKVFGIGMESYTVGSAEFCLSYSTKNGIVPLMDNGHYHPTEVVSDKISSLLLFNEKIALHITRPVRWDSDHVVLFDDDYVKASKIVKDNIVSLLDGNGNLYYDPNLIVTVMLPSDLKEIMMDFLLEPDTDFSLLADKVIKECGAEIFRRSLFEGLSEWDPVYSFNYVEKYKQYLSDEEIAKLTIDRYRAIPILERGDIEYLDPRTKKMIKDVAKRTGREFSFT